MMRNPTYLVFLSAISCAPPAVAPSAPTAAPAGPAIPLPDARDRFTEAAALCAADHGLTWGRTLCGPMMVVDPASRAVVANQADAEHRLVARDGVFVGVLPAGENTANTSVTWAGVRWIQLRWPLPPDRARRAVLMMHESFHWLAEQLPILRATSTGNAHLDDPDGRYYLQLEWRALAAALRATTEDERRAAIGDALAFRRTRRARFPGSAPEEDGLELNEGLAEYTGVVVGLRDPAARVDAALRALARGAEVRSFVRSFAYATGPALGLLLDRHAPGWRARIAELASLSDALAAAVDAPRPDADRAAASYGGTALRAAEDARAAERDAAVRRYRARLVDGPVATLRLFDMHIAFDPNTVQPIGAPGSVYPTLRIVDDWGVLEVTGGALIKADWSAVVIPAPASASAGIATGDGWTLSLAPGWRLEPDERPGDLRLAGRSPAVAPGGSAPATGSSGP
jgi:hypothetical protein